MQLVLSGNRIIAHGENFLAMGGVVINTETGTRFENATIAECDGCPSDIDAVGYEYHAGVFVPCAPYGKGNNNGYFMEVCADCATPRNSGIKIKNGIKLANLNSEVTAKNLGGASLTLQWENASPKSDFEAQTVSFAVSSPKFDGYIVEAANYTDGTYHDAFSAYFPCLSNDYTAGEHRTKGVLSSMHYEESGTGFCIAMRKISCTYAKMTFEEGRRESLSGGNSLVRNNLAIPLRIYGVER